MNTYFGDPEINILTNQPINDMKLISVKTILGLSGLLLFACNNEDFNERGEVGNPSDYISFGVTPADGVQTKGVTRADAKEYVAGSFVLRSADSADTLCVRTVISDGIQGAAIGEKPITRGKPLNPGDEFYEAFHVLTIQDGSQTEFFMNDDVKKGTYTDGVWETDETYYWPGAEHTLQFYAWAPIEGSFSPTPTSPAELKFGYTVPTDVTAQQDIVVAQTPRAGDYKQAVPLSFKHICTAVRFVVGAQMQPGTIQSISLNGVYNAGTYDMSGLSETSAGSWALTGTGNFKQSLNKAMTGTEGQGEEITLVEGTFMMLPQTLPSGAEVVVEFQDDATGNLRTLRASIAGSEWPMGKTVTYQLAITPEYDMSITCERDKVDAHVDIEEITIEADGPWVLSSDVDWLTFTDWSYDTSKPEERPLGHRGYWIRSERGNKTFSGSGNMTLYAYYDENLTDANRTANITLSYPGTSKVGAQKTVTQYCPAWSGNAGYERWEEDHRWEEDGSKTFTYPFGFAWDRKVEFTAAPKFNWPPSIRDIFGAYVFLYIANNAIENYGASDYVTVKEDKFLGLTIRTTVTIDYSKFNAIGDLVTPDDGLTNTRNLYGFQNIGQVSAIENVLRDNAVGNFTENVIQDSHGNIPVDQFAARRIAMKNEFQKVLREQTVEGETIRYYEALINVNDIHWYLPASNEQVSLKAGLTGDDEPLEGEYWSSTAVNNNTQAYKYTPDGNYNAEDRMATHKMRAAVRK